MGSILIKDGPCWLQDAVKKMNAVGSIEILQVLLGSHDQPQLEKKRLFVDKARKEGLLNVFRLLLKIIPGLKRRRYPSIP